MNRCTELQCSTRLKRCIEGGSGCSRRMLQHTRSNLHDDIRQLYVDTFRNSFDCMHESLRQRVTDSRSRCNARSACTYLNVVYV